MTGTTGAQGPQGHKATPARVAYAAILGPRGTTEKWVRTARLGPVVRKATPGLLEPLAPLESA